MNLAKKILFSAAVLAAIGISFIVWKKCSKPVYEDLAPETATTVVLK